MATTLRIGFQRDETFIVETQEELTSVIDQVSAASADQPCSSLVEITVADDPFGFPSVYAGLGASRGFVQVSGPDSYRVTIGDPDVSGDVIYDYQDHGTEIPAREEVPLSTVRTVLAAYLTHGGLIPEEFAELYPVDID